MYFEPEDSSAEKIHKVFMAAVFVTAVILLVWMATACTTVAPKPVTSSEASYDGQMQNSGLVGQLSSGEWIITTHARDRYLALVARWGTIFRPPATNDFGITAYTNGTYRIDNQRLSQFVRMNRKEKGEP